MMAEDGFFSCANRDGGAAMQLGQIPPLSCSWRTTYNLEQPTRVFGIA
jgi:hypothetical protein